MKFNPVPAIKFVEQKKQELNQMNSNNVISAKKEAKKGTKKKEEEASASDNDNVASKNTKNQNHGTLAHGNFYFKGTLDSRVIYCPEASLPSELDIGIKRVHLSQIFNHLIKLNAYSISIVWNLIR
jgi:hypothetical protein